MVLQFYLLEPDHDPGAGAETVERDIPRAGVTKAIIIDMIAQTNGTSTGTRADLTAQLDQLSIGAVESNRVSEIDGEDLDGYNVLRGNHTLIDTSIVANQRNSWQYVYPFDPFMIGANADYNRPFGIPGTIARKIRVLYAADVATDAGLNIDEKRMALSAIIRTDQATAGYQAFTRDSFTATAGTNNFTTIPTSGPNSKLLGVLNFESTSAADVTVDAERRDGQTIREQAVTVNRRDILGPVYTTVMAGLNGQYETGALNDEGYSYWNFGINSDNNLGVPTAGGIPSEMEIRTLGGGTDATRVYGCILNTNI